MAAPRLSRLICAAIRAAEVSSLDVHYQLYGVGEPRPSVPRAYGRDLAFEWRLLRRADPDHARRIEAAADKLGRWIRRA